MKKWLTITFIFICAISLIGCNKGLSTKVEDSKKVVQENKYEVAGIDNPVEFEKMFNTVKELVADGNKEGVEKYIIYPLRINTPKEKTTIKTKKEFIKNYDAIFTDKVKTVLENQKVKDLFVNYQGVMVGDGQIWFGAGDKDPSKYGIIAINK